jgi:uncharacterized protein (DUF1810 family)
VRDIAGRTGLEIFGSPDDLKLRSCATLFAAVSDEDVFGLVLRKYFNGEHDKETLRLLGRKDHVENTQARSTP